jgi:hypothetical protein
MYRRYTPYRHYYRHNYGHYYPRYRRHYRRYYPRKRYTEKDQNKVHESSGNLSVLDMLRLMFMEGMGR